MNENEVKIAVCSVTGRRCRCTALCNRRGCVDTDPRQDLQWARTAILRLRNASEALDLAIDALVYDRPHPAPEWRDKVKRINRLISELEKETKV